MKNKNIKIIYKEKNEEKFWRYWENYVTQNKVGPNFLKLSLEYSTLLSKTKHSDKSFVYSLDNRPVACVFLPIEKLGEELFISTSAGYVYAPLVSKKKVEKKIFTLIDEIAATNNVSKIMFSIDPLEGTYQHNFLQQYNYLDTSLLTYIINLESSENLLGACRKGHKCDIKKIQRNSEFEIFYMDKNNASYDTHEKYRQLHHKCAGRITRSKETFDMQFEKIKQGKAILVGLKHKNKIIAFSGFEFSANKAIYASTADDPDYDKLPLYHILMFSAMEYLKKIGVQYINVLQPSCPSKQFDYYPDKKQLNIALFKRGFPGNFRSHFRGIKYFSENAFKKDMQKFSRRFTQ